MSIEQRYHAGVYGLVLNAPGTHILLVRKILGCYTGLYDLPGGTQDPGESHVQTLIREMHEETRMTVAADVDCLGMIETQFAYEDKGKPCVLNHRAMIFRIDGSSAIETNLTSADTAGTVWVPIADCTTATVSPIVIGAIKLNA